MPLQKRLIDVPLALGLGQKSDSRYTQIGEASSLINARKLKTQTARKRFGHTPLQFSDLGVAVAGGSYKGIPLMFGTGGSSAIVQWSDAAQRWHISGLIPEYGCQDQIPVGAGVGIITDVQIEQGNGYNIVAYSLDGLGLGNAQIYTTVLDAVTNAIVWSAQPLTLTGPVTPVAQGIKLVVLGTTCVLAYCPNATTINAVTMDMTAPWQGWSATATTLANDVENTTGGAVAVGVFDVQPVVNDSTRFIIAYPTFGPSLGMKTKTFNAALTLQATNALTAVFPGTAIWAVAVYVRSGEQTWVACQNDRAGGINHPGVLIWKFPDPTGATSNLLLVGLDNINDTNAGKVTIERNNSSDVTVGWCPFAFDPNNASAYLSNAWTKFRQVHAAGNVLTLPNSEMFIPSLLLGSKPVNGGGVAWVMMYAPSFTQGTQLLIALDWWGNNQPVSSPERIVSIVVPRQWKNIPIAESSAMSNGTVQTSVSLPRLITPTGQVIIAPVFQSQAVNHSGLALQAFDAQLNARCFSAELADELIFGDGASMSFDGQQTAELGYAYYPEVGAPSLGGAGLTGTFSYIFIWEWYDDRGYVHWSATSPALTVVLTNQVPTFRLPVLGATNRAPGTAVFPGPNVAAQVAIVPYRTTNGGTIYYRNTTDPAPVALQNSATNYAAGFISWTDTTTDSVLSAGGTQLLYTLGGVLDNFCPPGKNICIVHKSRAWLAGGGQAIDLWPSQAVNPGTMPGFNEALVFQCSGPITGLASLDDKLIVFVRRGSQYGAEYITGDGPTNIGTQSDWTPPQPIPTGGVGVVDQRSLAQTDKGLFFLSPIGGPNGKGGIFTLTRGLQVEYIGGPVEDLVAKNPICTSAVTHPNGGYVYFTMVSADNGLAGFPSGVRLVWDYLQQIWSVDTLSDPDTLQTSAGARWGWVAEAPAGLTYHWLTSQGRVYRETNGVGSNSYTDAGAWITMSYQSAQVKTALSGFHRFWRMQAQSDSLDPCDITFTLTFDGAPASAYNEAWTWSASSINSFDRFPQVDVEFLVGNQKAKSITVSYSDAPPTGGPVAATGQGMQLAAFTVELGVDGTRYPNIPAGQRA